MSDTPKSDAAIAMLPAFVEQMQARLEMGKRAYGDSSFERPMSSLIIEIQQEFEDAANWSFMAWTALEKLKTRVLDIENEAAIQRKEERFTAEPICTLCGRRFQPNAIPYSVCVPCSTACGL